MEDKKEVRCPGFPWPGGKVCLAPEILKHIPQRGRKFIDVFGGRGSITLRAIFEGLHYEEFVVNDILTAPFLQALIDHGEKFTCGQDTQEEFDRCVQLAIAGDPYALLMEPRLSFNGGSYGDGRRSEGKKQSPEAYTQNVRRACELLRSRKVRIAQLDWLDCLRQEKPGPDDCVLLDPPYMEAKVHGYRAEQVSPTEIISTLREAPCHWALCEYDQPLYVSAFGEPTFKKNVQLRSAHVTQKERRTECLWGSSTSKRNVIDASDPVPECRPQAYYKLLTDTKLLEEIKKCMGTVSFSRNQMQRELRLRLTPALLELRKRTYRKKPGFYETLKAIGLNPDTVRQWFYRSNTADEVIAMLEEEPKKPEPGKPGMSAKDELLLHADRMASAVVSGNLTHAKKLATEYLQARKENEL